MYNGQSAMDCSVDTYRGRRGRRRKAAPAEASASRAPYCQGTVQIGRNMGTAGSHGDERGNLDDDGPGTPDLPLVGEVLGGLRAHWRLWAICRGRDGC